MSYYKDKLKKTSYRDKLKKLYPNRVSVEISRDPKVILDYDIKKSKQHKKTQHRKPRKRY
jgi:hypothetical protein